MIWRWLRRVLIGLAVVLVCLLSFAYFVVATESGTNWLLARAEPYLPTELTLNQVSGTLLSGLTVKTLSWQNVSIDAQIHQLYLQLRFRPLLTNHLAFEVISAQQVQISSVASATASSDNAQFAVDLPIKISVAAAEFRNIHINTDEQSLIVDRIDIIATASGSTVSLLQLMVSSDWLTLDAQGEGRLSPPYDLDGSVTWGLNNIAARTWSGNLQIDGDTSGYDIAHSLSQPVVINTAGVINIEEAVVDLLTDWQALKLPLGDGRVLHSSGGKLQVSGGLDSYVVDSDALIGMDNWPEASVNVSGRGSASQFNLEGLHVDADFVNLSAAGRLDWAGEGLPADSPLELIVLLDTISGSYNGQPLDGAIVLRTQQGRLFLDDSWLAVGENRVAASGDLTPNIDIALQWDMPEMAALASAAAGRSQGSVRVQRPDANWIATGSASGQSLSWLTYSMGSVVIDGSVVTNGSSDVSLVVTDVQVGTFEFDAAEVRATGLTDSHDISFALQSGEQRLQLQAAGGYRQQKWSGQLAQFRFVDGQRSDWSTSAASELWFSDSEFDVAICLQEKTTASRICADSTLQKSGEGSITASLQDLPLGQLPLGLLAEPMDATGLLSLDLDGHWRDGLLNGSLSAQLEDATFSTEVEGEPLTAELEHAVARATVVDNLLQANAELRLLAGGTATAQGSIANVMSQSSVVDANAIIELTNLSFVPLLFPVISNTSGTINGELSVAGNMGAAVLGGELRLADGAFDANNAGIGVSGINLRVSQSAAGNLSLRGSARSGDGNISVSGESRIDATEGLLASVAIKGEDFEFVRLPQWQAVASPDLQVTLDNQTAKVRGQLRVPRARVSLNTLPESAESISADAIVHGREVAATSPKRRFDIDVKAILGSAVELSGFGLETQLTGDLRLRGGSPEPFIGTGRIELQDGRYTAYGQELKIERGALLFSGPLTNPTLDIQATRDVDDVTAGLNLRGTPSNLRSSVFSEPALSDAEALSYLIAGRPLATASDQESNRVGQAAFALGLTGADKVIAQLQSKLGLDSLVIESGDDVGRIVAGRRIGGRLLVEYGYGLVDRLGTLLLRYQLNRRLVVETTTGTTNTLDVVYSVKKN